MSSGNVNFRYPVVKDDFIIDQDSSIDILKPSDVKNTDLNQILLISEDINNTFKYVHFQPFDDITFDLFHNVIEIHLLLLNNKDLSNDQKLDYCRLERFFMKKYLREMIKKTFSE
jgi:hypothetical protein